MMLRNDGRWLETYLLDEAQHELLRPVRSDNLVCTVHGQQAVSSADVTG
jgi:hypothetical protein